MGKEEKKNGHANGISTTKAPEKPRTFERKIEHRLSQTELVQFGVKHRAMLRAIDEKNAQRKAVAVTYRQDVDAMREEEREIRVALDSGVEMRKTLCFERRNERLHTIEVATVDDEQVIDSRPMSGPERQVTIPGVELPTPKAEAPKAKRARKAKGAEATAP